MTTCQEEAVGLQLTPWITFRVLWQRMTALRTVQIMRVWGDGYTLTQSNLKYLASLRVEPRELCQLARFVGECACAEAHFSGVQTKLVAAADNVSAAAAAVAALRRDVAAATFDSAAATERAAKARKRVTKAHEQAARATARPEAATRCRSQSCTKVKSKPNANTAAKTNTKSCVRMSAQDSTAIDDAAAELKAATSAAVVVYFAKQRLVKMAATANTAVVMACATAATAQVWVDAALQHCNTANARMEEWVQVLTLAQAGVHIGPVADREQGIDDVLP